MTTAGVLDGLQEKLKKEKENSLPSCLPSYAPALHWTGSLFSACWWSPQDSLVLSEGSH